MDKPKPTRPRRLTAQELEVLTLAVGGHTLEEIARRLRISTQQAKTLFDECIAQMIRAPASDADDADKSASAEQQQPPPEDPESPNEE